MSNRRTDAELDVLLTRARRIIDGDQEVLDFEAPSRIVRAEEVGDGRPEPERDPADMVAAAGRTLGMSSRLLYEVLSVVYDRLGCDDLGDAVFRGLVIPRIVERASKG